MKTILAEIVGHLRSKNYRNEEHVRVAIVLRILQALGWDIWNPRECCPEFATIPDENAKRVDVALFKPPSFFVPAMFIEVKAVGKLEQNLKAAENQLGEYCLRNQADIAVLTDGRQWHFYLPGASGRFDQRCFKVVDLLDAAVPCEEIERTFCTFLSRDSLISGDSVDQAKLLLKRTDEQRTMDEVLPVARKDAEQNPTVSLVDCFIERCAERGVSIDTGRAKEFILKKSNPSLQSTKSTQGQQTISAPPVIQPQTQVTSNVPGKRMRLMIPRKGVEARGILHSDGKRITVLAGAFAAAKTDKFESVTRGYVELHKKLVTERVLVQTILPTGGDGFKLTQDYTFTSLSAAAVMLCGRSAQGPELWKEDN